MKNSKPTLQKKRKPASGFRVLRAVTKKTGPKRKRTHRAATTADPNDVGEIPGVSVARALVVILLLHVAAIAGIYIHNQWTNSEAQKATVQKPEDKASMQPALIPGVEHYSVLDGDNYFKIAEKKGVSVAELKRFNNNIDITPGIKINIPGRRTELAQAEPAVSPQGVETFLPPMLIERPQIQVSNDQIIPGSIPGELMEAENAPAISHDEPVLIRPKYREPVPIVVDTQPAQRISPPVDRPVIPPARTVPSGRSHVIQKGDTIWRLSKKYGVSQSELMRLNGISDPGKIRLGAKLRIPGR